jgi:hypothetical protein
MKQRDKWRGWQTEEGYKQNGFVVVDHDWTCMGLALYVGQPNAQIAPHYPERNPTGRGIFAGVSAFPGAPHCTGAGSAVVA